MQETSHDDFSILNGDDAVTHAIAKDVCPTLVCKIQSISPINNTDTTQQKLTKDGAESEVTSVVPVKLEDINTLDLFPSHANSWQQYQIHDLANRRQFLEPNNSYQHNSSNLLLQGSDDPLISHGANSVLTNDDEQLADFAKSLMTQTSNRFQISANKQESGERLLSPAEQQQPPRTVVKSGCSSLTRQQLKAKANLMSARNQQQQQEQQQQQNQNQYHSPSIETPTTITGSNQRGQQRTNKTKNKKSTTLKLRFHHQALPPEYLSHYEATQGLQRTCTKTHVNTKTSTQRNSTKPAGGFQKPSHSRNSHENVRSWLQKIAEIQRAANASKQVNNCMPQKPVEKQDSVTSNEKIHEIQQTYHSVTTDANNNLNKPKRLDVTKKYNLLDSTASHGFFKADVNRGSLVKRPHYSELPYMGEMTLDNCKPRRGRKPKKADICHLIYKNYGTIFPPKKTEPEKRSDNFPANRDSVEQPLNLCLRDQVNDSYSISSGDELSETNSSCPTPVSTPFDAVRDTMLASNLKKSLSDISEQGVAEPTSSKLNNALSSNKDTFAQPITLCLKKLLDSGLLLQNGNGRYKTIRKDNQLALKIPIPSGSVFPIGRFEKFTPKQIILNSDYSESVSTSSAIPTQNSTNLNQNQHLLLAPQKRKRSAIFIPPMNVENTNNPATEVSICKFKFTGGSNPSLEEKKMISVDAGGNYRYFSGTGDKASRGFEYFPREVLQHTAGLLPGVNCTGHKLSHDMIPAPSHDLNHDLLHISESNLSSAELTGRHLNSNSTVTAFESNSNQIQTLYGT